MIEIGASKAKNTFSALLDRVERGEEIIITRYGRPVARLVPNAGRIDVAQAQAAIERMRKRAAEAALGPFDWDAVERDRDMGRP